MAGPLPQHRPRRRFGQHFLRDPAWLERLVTAIDPRPGQNLVEIGPGEAALTDRLVERAGALTAIELDRDLAAWLRDRYEPGRLRLIEADALRVDWAELCAGEPPRLVGNLPYNISTPLLFGLLPWAGRIVDQHFMLQREVVERMTAAPGGRSYGRLSVHLRWRYRMTALFEVPPDAFDPPPKVWSAVVRMVPRRPEELIPLDFAALSRVTAAAFGQRRKTLRNALAGLLDEARVRAAGVDPGARAETLDVADFAALTRALGDGPPQSGAK